jgi:hypothetical protein
MIINSPAMIVMSYTYGETLLFEVPGIIMVGQRGKFFVRQVGNSIRLEDDGVQPGI